MKGKKVTNGMTLVNFNSKVQQETKDIIDAFVKVNNQDIYSAREFLEKAVELYSQAFPADMEKAQQYLELIGKGAK